MTKPDFGAYNTAIRSNKNVVGLNVAMEYTFTSEIYESLNNTLQNTSGLALE